MKYYIIAGEASGDLHGSNLIKGIRKFDADAHIRAWGGPLMEEQGAVIAKNYKELAFMGIVEVLFNIRTIAKNFSFCKDEIKNYKPDVVIFIDYPGFNLRMAAFVKKLKIPTVYYISPTVWAWKEGRIKQIKRDVDVMLSILPFEKEFYKKHNHDVDYVGHPLLDAISNYRRSQQPKREDFLQSNGLQDKPIVALLPGSRKQEISTKLPVMLEVSKMYPDYQFVIAGAPSFDAEYYKQFTGESNVPVLFGKTYDILSFSHAAMVTSGTATLETALFRIPQVVCYRANVISYHIVKRMVKIKYISLVNLIMDKLVVKELIQNELNVTNLKREFDAILNVENRARILNQYNELIEKLGNEGASEKAGRRIVEFLRSK